MAPDVQIRGKLAAFGAGVDALTSQAEFGSVEVELCGYGSEIPRVPGDSHLALLTSAVPAQPASDPNAGSYEFSVFSNGLIEPPGTYYTFTVRNQNGDAVQCDAFCLTPGSYDITELSPFDPTLLPNMRTLPPLIISQLQILTASGSGATGDGQRYLSFQINLDADDTAQVANAREGNRYTFIVVQDEAGNHTLTWPENFLNPPDINPVPHGMTIQTFVAIPNTATLEGMNFIATGAPTWSVQK